jgi:hypothetical protein
MSFFSPYFMVRSTMAGVVTSMTVFDDSNGKITIISTEIILFATVYHSILKNIINFAPLNDSK